MDNNLFTGNLFRLVIDESQTLGKAVSHWARDTEFMRLQDSYPARLFSVQKCQAFVETDDQATQGKNFLFYIRTLDDNLLIGDAGLTVIQWTHKEAYLGITYIPCLLVYGDRDPAITTPDEDFSLSTMTHQIELENSGHFPMIDETSRFNRLVTDFLALDSGVSPRELQMKEEWRRRVR